MNENTRLKTELSDLRSKYILTHSISNGISFLILLLAAISSLLLITRTA